MSTARFNTQVGIALLLLAVLIGSFGSYVLGRQASKGPNTVVQNAVTPNSRSISVTGRAEQHITPDRATVTLVITTSSRQPNESQRLNDQQSALVITGVKQAGAQSSEIDPGGIQITEDIRTENDIRITDYVVSSEVVIRTAQLPKVRAMLRNAFEAGATTGKIAFSTSKLRQLRDDAREAAVKAAVEKATSLTRAAGARKGRVTSISEDDFGYRGMGSQSVNASQNIAQTPSSSTDASMADQFGGGMITVSATVSASFDMI